MIDQNFKWSFSKLSTYNTCPFSFWLQYMQDPPLDKQQNAWAEFGNLCHELLEQYGKGELTLEQLPVEYEKRYSGTVVHNFPPTPKDYAEKAYRQGLEYFQNFKGFGDRYEIVSTEEKFQIKVGNYDFVGISDLVLRDKETGELIVIDHKTKSPSSMKKDLSVYRNQLHVYAEHVHQKYGRYPESTQFNMIKSQDSISEPFRLDIHSDSLRWIEDTIDLIHMEEDWEPNPDYYYCRWICPMLQHCQAGMDICQGGYKKKR